MKQLAWIRQLVIEWPKSSDSKSCLQNFLLQAPGEFQGGKTKSVPRPQLRKIKSEYPRVGSIQESVYSRNFLGDSHVQSMVGSIALI